MKSNKYNVVSLFTGAGSLDIGFEEFGKFSIICASDIKEECNKTYNLNYPKVPFSNKDIRTIILIEMKEIINCLMNLSCSYSYLDYKLANNK